MQRIGDLIGKIRGGSAFQGKNGQIISKVKVGIDIGRVERFNVGQGEGRCQVGYVRQLIVAGGSRQNQTEFGVIVKRISEHAEGLALVSPVMNRVGAGGCRTERRVAFVVECTDIVTELTDTSCVLSRGL